MMQSKAPNAVIILMGIFPRNDNMAVMPEIDRINANLARMADGRKIRYLNINDQLADHDGKLHDGMMNARDKLHPALQGYQVWADALKPILRNCSGRRRAKTTRRRPRAIHPRANDAARRPTRFVVRRWGSRQRRGARG